LPKNPDEDIIQANQERMEQWQLFRDSKLLPGVV
jgi:hypothetical protein